MRVCALEKKLDAKMNSGEENKAGALSDEDIRAALGAAQKK